MRIFATNEVVAKSRFWYFLRYEQTFLRPEPPNNAFLKVKKANGEIIGVNVVRRLSLVALKRQAEWDC